MKRSIQGTETKHYIPQICAKLINEGLNQDNYEQFRALEILNRCVAPVFLRKVLLKHESEIKKALPRETAKSDS